MARGLFVLIFVFISSLIFAQEPDQEKLIQLSGIVMTSDSLQAIPYTNIYHKGSGRGTVSNYKGFFSLVVQKGDTIVFSNIGFKKSLYVVPLDLSENKYSVIQLLTRDTINLAETIIYPWPTPEQFREAFLTLNIPDDDLERAKKNLERERMKEMSLAMGNDANEALDAYMRTESSKYYYYGQTPPMNIFNPFAWAKFIEAWKRGDYKKK